MKTELIISCCFCSNTSTINVELDNGWTVDSDYGIDYEQGFCPEHADVKPFRDSQCPGCVGGWGDCTLWNSFAYSGGRNLKEADFNQLERGICPKRTNGTSDYFHTWMVVTNGQLDRLDLSDVAPPESGRALANAIRRYWVDYPDNELR